MSTISKMRTGDDLPLLIRGATSSHRSFSIIFWFRHSLEDACRSQLFIRSVNGIKNGVLYGIARSHTVDILKRYWGKQSCPVSSCARWNVTGIRFIRLLHLEHFDKSLFVHASYPVSPFPAIAPAIVFILDITLSISLASYRILAAAYSTWPTIH